MMMAFVATTQAQTNSFTYNDERFADLQMLRDAGLTPAK